MQLTQAVLGITVETKDAKLKLNELETSFHRLFTSVVQVSAFTFTKVASGLFELSQAIAESLNKFQGFQSMMVAVNKDTAAARQEFNFLLQLANELGFRVESLELNYSKLRVALKGVSDGGEIARTVFTGVAMAARTMHSSGEDTRLMFYAITQMASKGVISMEELRRQLGEKLPGVMDVAASAVGVTTQKLEEMVRTGKMQAIPFLRLFGPAMIEAFSESAKAASGTLDAAIARLRNLWTQFIVVINDSGAAKAMADVIDSLRAKLEDPAVFEAFADVIKSMAANFKDFIDAISKQDIYKLTSSIADGLHAFTIAAREAAEIAITLAKNVQEIIAMLVGLRTAQLGMQLGGKSPLGAVIGTAVGGAIGYLGTKEGIDYLLEQSRQQAAAATQARINQRNIERQQEAAREAAMQPSRQAAGKALSEQILPGFDFDKSGIKVTQDQINRLGVLAANMGKTKTEIEITRNRAVEILYNFTKIKESDRAGLMGDGEDKKKKRGKTLEQIMAEEIEDAKRKLVTIQKAETEYEKMLFEVSEGKYKERPLQHKANLLGLAMEADLTKYNEQVQINMDKAYQAQLQYMENMKDKAILLKKKYDNRYNPAEEYARELREVKVLEDQGMISEEESSALVSKLAQKATADSVTGKADKVIRDLREEVQLLQLSNTEREIRTQLFNLEAAGIQKGSEEWYKYVEQVKKLSAEKVQLERLDDVAKSVGLTFSSAFEDALVAGKEFSEILQGIEKDLIRLAARKFVTEPLFDLFGSGMRSVLKMVAGVGHIGGLVGTSNFVQRTVNPLLFAGAPRLHNGLAPDEFPAILQRGERVIPKNKAGGGALTINVPVTVSGSPTADTEALATGLQAAVRVAVNEELMKQMRPGGRLRG